MSHYISKIVLWIYKHLIFVLLEHFTCYKSKQADSLKHNCAIIYCPKPFKSFLFDKFKIVAVKIDNEPSWCIVLNIRIRIKAYNLQFGIIKSVMHKLVNWHKLIKIKSVTDLLSFARSQKFCSSKHLFNIQGVIKILQI